MLGKPFAKRLFAISMIASASGFLAGCEESTFSPATARSQKPLPAKTLAEMEAIGSTKSAPVLIRAYKKESELEIWKLKADGRYAYLKSFPMCRWSGQLGPKVREGDRQVPEGFYAITPSRMNPNSAYYLSFDVGYPNAYDRALGRKGGAIMVHGVCSSAGCFSMTDAQIAEIYAIAREAFAGGQHAIQMQSYPFRMTAENLAKYRLDKNIGFWNQLKEGSDNFEVTKQDVAVGVCNKHYVFNAAPADGSHFDATAACPPLKRNAGTQAEVEAKQKRDDAKIAEFAAQGVRPVHTVYADGGQHPEFASLASYASRPEALAKGPVDIALDEGKSKKARKMAAAKQGAIKTAASSVQGADQKPAELVTVAAAPEPAKPQDSFFLARLWGGKPAEARAEAPALPATGTAAPQPAEVPLPPRRNEASTTVAKPRDANGKPQNSVAAPAQVKPQAAASPAKGAAKLAALSRGGPSTFVQADH
ncbi:MAG: L,D-transpeptidase family protein [Beijerinckiaceae bacterium]